MASDMFLKIKGIEGESTDEQHENWIEIHGFSHSLSQAARGTLLTASDERAERANHEPFTFTKAIDKASPYLLLYCSTGQRLDEAELHICRSIGSKEVYFIVKFKDVQIASVSSSHSSKSGGGNEGGTGKLPTETFSISYSQVEWTYNLTSHDTGKKGGFAKAKWDLRQGKGKGG